MHLFRKPAFQTDFSTKVFFPVGLIILLNPHLVSPQYVKRVSTYFLLEVLGSCSSG